MLTVQPVSAFLACCRRADGRKSNQFGSFAVSLKLTFNAKGIGSNLSGGTCYYVKGDQHSRDQPAGAMAARSLPRENPDHRDGG